MTHLVRLPVNLRALAAFAAANGASDDDGGYALHLALRRRFGGAGPQPFRLFADGPAAPHLLGYLADPAPLADAAALPAADPLLDPVFPDPPQLRAMPDGWREGARYGFEVRARPVVRFGARVKAERAAAAPAGPEHWHARAGEVDAWIAARTRPGGDPEVTRETAYRDWLATRLTPAAAIESAEVTLFRRTRTHRSTHGRPGRGSVEGPEAVVKGTLAIQDAAAFAALLSRGIGRHAAFGFGMLLLSPAR
ncbi:type I-E CRISPR-associated protein Cas6/Cse3/CasE [Sphingomonas sp.]|uniref:type I-E CRISPR-associated protein Cas6/Cse3/CasE n=1 Tax=Sphingomonas sp. TaxID=28214 RepID=UPI0035C803E0